MNWNVGYLPVKRQFISDLDNERWKPIIKIRPSFIHTYDCFDIITRCRFSPDGRFVLTDKWRGE